jgi:phosphoribosylaminoimidazolecarboxamide formyltransferase/IMP cyclohydrolase
LQTTTIDVATAIEINKLFCEVVIAPKYDKEAITIWKRKNRIILIQNEVELPNKQVRTCLNGLLIQERNNITEMI